ncbi:MAG TPA: peptidylprolyl isomerase [Sphingomonas sp.]
MRSTILSVRARLRREPLTVFVLVGAFFFLLYWAIDGRRETIEVTKPMQASLADDYATMSGHQPGPAEARQLTDTYVADELLFREAVRRGLHLSDRTIKQRMIDQMRFLIAGTPADPTEAQLRRFYARHAPLYRGEPAISFTHVFFSKPPVEPQAILARLDAGMTVAGDDFWMGHTLPQYGESMISGMFGLSFLDALRKAPTGVWEGPVRSSRGYHFVRVDQRMPPVTQTYDQMRDQVRQDYLSSQSGAAISAEVDKLKKGYDVVIDH